MESHPITEIREGSENPEKVEESKIPFWDKELTLYFPDDKSTDKVSIPLVYECLFMREIIDELTEDTLDQKIDLKEITSTDWPLIKEFLTILQSNDFPKDIPKPLESKNLEDYFSQQYVEWINKIGSVPNVDRFLVNALYLNCKPLMTICAVKLAASCRNKTADEIRELFGVQNDFTEEEKEAIRKEEEEEKINA